LLFVSFVLSAAAQAQTAAAPAAPAPTEAPKTAAPKKQVFDDWTLLCATPPGADAPSCEVDATLQPDGQLPPVAKIAFLLGAGEKPVRLAAIVQANLTIQPGVEIAPDAAKKGVILGFKSCLNSACLADAELSAAEVQGFRGLKAPGRLTIRNAASEELSLQVPFHGLDEALDALLAQRGP
jgi:invasion protein IalB